MITPNPALEGLEEEDQERFIDIEKDALSTFFATAGKPFAELAEMSARHTGDGPEESKMPPPPRNQQALAAPD